MAKAETILIFVRSMFPGKDQGPESADGHQTQATEIVNELVLHAPAEDFTNEVH